LKTQSLRNFQIDHIKEFQIIAKQFLSLLFLPTASKEPKEEQREGGTIIMNPGHFRISYQAKEENLQWRNK
jgi:hypothetical protein